MRFWGLLPWLGRRRYAALILQAFRKDYSRPGNGFLVLLRGVTPSITAVFVSTGVTRIAPPRSARRMSTWELLQLETNRV